MTTAIGGIAEMYAAIYFVKRKYIVSRPLFDNARYDLLIDNGRKILKVQVKSRKSKNGRVVIELYSSHGKQRGHRNYKNGDFDLLFIYVPELHRAAIISWIEIMRAGVKTKLTLLLDADKSQKNSFSKYEIILPKI